MPNYRMVSWPAGQVLRPKRSCPPAAPDALELHRSLLAQGRWVCHRAVFGHEFSTHTCLCVCVCARARARVCGAGKKY